MNKNLEKAVLEFHRDEKDIDAVMLGKPTVLYNCGSLLTQLADEGQYSALRHYQDRRFYSLCDHYCIDPAYLGVRIKGGW